MTVNKGAEAALLLRATKICAKVLSAGIWRNVHDF
jgi:hypothetical protein